MRADAVRNRAKVLAAADELVAERGPAVSTEEVAKAAGVGVGTVFRHFPTKESLLTAVHVARLERLADSARQLTRAEDPGAALFTFVTQVVDQAATKNAMTEALTNAGIDVMGVTSEAADALKQALGELLENAQRAGAVRTDIGVPELSALLVGASRAAEHAAANPRARERVLSVIRDGMRAHRSA
ncbi:TetR/AcrR family transcriptional regulator [Saccharothrix variisporea]|uniref:TetR family transcriptional regulator n=1 Tax=Saccharothrix variisporea TaxID=543527 RepID=A0A495X909_9PSEU|nr:TetR/AcrR family transcriptional regulator [Saccharothrix variisporea]RKT69093.1 TetR family transcriptional regulator [Saccharothrix variisporea]